MTLNAPVSQKLVQFTDINGNPKFFDESRSLRYEVIPEYVNNESSVEASLYWTKSGRWIHWIKQTSHCLEMYGIFEPDPPDRIVEVSLHEAASLLLDPRRRAERDEPPLPEALRNHIRDLSIDDADWQAEAEDVKPQLIVFEGADGTRRSFDLRKCQVWEGPQIYSSRFGAKLFRHEDGFWICLTREEGYKSSRDQELRLPHYEVKVNSAIDWFLDKKREIPDVLVADLNRLNERIDAKREDVADDLPAETDTIEVASPICIKSEPAVSVTQDERLEPEQCPYFPSLEMLVFDDTTESVWYRGIRHSLRETVYRGYKKIAFAECRLNLQDIEAGRFDKVLKRWLKDSPLLGTIDSKPGPGGGYRLKAGIKPLTHNSPQLAPTGE